MSSLHNRSGVEASLLSFIRSPGVCGSRRCPPVLLLTIDFVGERCDWVVLIIGRTGYVRRLEIKQYTYSLVGPTGLQGGEFY